jgi:ribosomal-protein-alanine N-acetyltransferase
VAEIGAQQALRYIESKRLKLVPATRNLVTSDLAGRDALATSLQVDVPDNWPPDLYDRQAMEFALRGLTKGSDHGWSFWYLIDKSPEPGTVIGICGFKGRPDEHGRVEIGYSILEQFRNLGFASEAVARLVRWAFTFTAVREVCAETFPHLRQSIRVLQKNGFAYAGPGSEHGVIRYAVNRSALA